MKLNTPINSTPRTVKLISLPGTKMPWGISILFTDGESSESIDWFFESEEEMHAAYEMWETLIYAASEFNSEIDEEQEDEDDSE